MPYVSSTKIVVQKYKISVKIYKKKLADASDLSTYIYELASTVEMSFVYCLDFKIYILFISNAAKFLTNHAPNLST